MKIRGSIMIIGWLLLMHGLAEAQVGSVHSGMQTIDSLYNSGAYLSAEVEARRVLENPLLTDTTRILLHKYIAFSLIAQDKPVIAKEHFKSILTIDPNYSLDPVFTSPKILAVFDETKKSLLKSASQSIDTVSLSFQSNSVPISYRTVLFPGWEQLHEGRKSAGLIFLSGGIAALSSGIILEVLRSSARQDYLNATLPSEISSKYNRYNRYYKAETASFIAFAAVYLLSEIDVFTFSRSSSIALHPHSTTIQGSTLNIAFRF